MGGGVNTVIEEETNQQKANLVAIDIRIYSLHIPELDNIQPTVYNCFKTMHDLIRSNIEVAIAENNVKMFITAMLDITGLEMAIEQYENAIKSVSVAA